MAQTALDIEKKKHKTVIAVPGNNGGHTANFQDNATDHGNQGEVKSGENEHFPPNPQIAEKLLQTVMIRILLQLQIKKKTLSMKTKCTFLYKYLWSTTWKTTTLWKSQKTLNPSAPV